MIMKPTDLENEVKLWLERVFEKEHLKNLTVKILGNSEKGDGYLGDIVFVHASGTSENQSTQEYDLVLKCSKRSEALRNQGFVHEIFINEIYVYDQLLPSFNNFQREKGIENVFDSVPKFYGKYVGDSVEVIVFENLKEIGYDLYDKRIPLTRKHIDMVIERYAELHAISIAMQDQQPEKFQILIEQLYVSQNSLKENHKVKTEAYDMFKLTIEDVIDILKNDVEESVLLEWRNLKEQLVEILHYDGCDSRVKVVVHGDCWNNNFMFLWKDKEKKLPEKVAILDWQGTAHSSPIYDLSYFLFTCISEEDLSDLDNILKEYYSSFSRHVEDLGSCLPKLYPFEEFMNDWKKYCKFGIVMSSLIHKICSTEKDEVIDLADSADEGKSFAAAFEYDCKNKDNFKRRIRPIVEYAVKNKLV